ncbi:hypothetical protein B5M44_04405 [Shinella sumterensis]|uniref:hypothetical protein n=1 Tax=Shinella sumterensis TaxID=1967501 RepID=UPI00106E4332|nr:hypothetical protein [Shinella sumterensis]MCD1264014.1 hypothetical protein [Shinella sumterensis]TFE99445.1 hypothetical protein B5M44_04405 [Shinella sumterensis]
MHSTLPVLAPSSTPRYPTPLADAARERTRRLMAAHMRSARVELAVCTMIFAVIGFAAAYQL